MTAAATTSNDVESNGYSAVAKALHWLVAGGVVLQYVLAKLAENAEDGGARFRQFVLLANHKSVGITILALALVRLAWRLTHTPPRPLDMPAWQRVAASVSHGGLYALIVLLPLTGWLMSSSSNVPVSWFNLFQLPDLVGASEDAAMTFETVHGAMARVLFVLALLHVAASLKHALVDRDGIIGRIASPTSIVLFVLVVAAGLIALTPAGRADEPAGAWTIDYADSYIRFDAEQAGATFQGEWTDWHAELRFDPADPGTGAFEVSIVVAGVRTGDAERDETLMDPAFFDGDGYPEVRYRADGFSSNADGSFTAAGLIRVKGADYPVVLNFTVASSGTARLLTGTARLDRLALGIGTGEWSDTAWIGQFVDVSVRVAGRTG